MLRFKQCVSLCCRVTCWCESCSDLMNNEVTGKVSADLVDFIPGSNSVVGTRLVQFFVLQVVVWGSPQFGAYEVAANEIVAKNRPPCKRPKI